MNIDKLKNCLSELRSQINPTEVTSKKNFSDLCLITGMLQTLINRLDNPDKAKQIDKLCNPDE